MNNRYFICEQCKKAFPRYNSLVMHYNSTHRGDPHPTREECMVEELPEGYELRMPRPKPKPEEKKEAIIPEEGEGITPKEEGVYREMPEPSNILYRILSQFPGLPEGVVGEVMSWVEYKGVLHPMEVSHLLSQMAGVPKGASNIISQKYQLAMQKAAQEGNAELQMTLSGWQYNQPQLGQFGALSPMPGMMGQPGGQYQPMPPWGQPQMGYPQNQPYQQPPYQPPQPNKEITELRGVIEAQQNQIAQLANTLTKTEERKKEDVLNARLGQIEDAISSLINRPPTGEGESKSDKELEKLSSEIKGLREERTNNQIASLERTISELKDQQSAGQQDRIEQLEDKLDEYKRLAEKPATGRTEMDVVGSAVDKGIDKLSEAGKDIRAVVTAPQTKQQFSPQRKGAEQRRETGEKIARKVEDEARRAGKEDTFMSNEPVVS